MGTFAKYNASKKSVAATKIAACSEKISTVSDKILVYRTNANSESGLWRREITAGGEVCVKSRDIYTEKVVDGVKKSVKDGVEYYSNFDSNGHSSWSVAANYGGQACYEKYISPYMDFCDSLDQKWSTLKTKISDGLDKISKCLDAIETAATTFDGLSSNISTAIAELEAAGLADNIKIVNENGVEIMYYQIYDENGQVIGQFSISEMVNSFYTYTGSAMEAAIATGLMYGDTSIPEGYLDNIISGIGNSVYNIRGQGFMSVADIDGIEEVYNAIVGDGKYALITTEFESLLKDKKVDDNVADLFNKYLNSDTNADLTAGALFAAGVVANLGAKTYSDENAEEAEKRMKQLKNKSAEDKEKEEEQEEQDTGAGDDDATSQNDDGKNDWSDFGSDDGGYGGGPSGGNGNYDDGGSSNDGGNTDGGETPTTTPPTTDNGGNTPETDNRFTDVVEAEIPSEPMEIEVTNEDIDALARDEFYEKYSIPEDLAERRQMDIDKFEELFNSENKEELVNKFIEMGYDPAEALGAANNKDVGLAAFLLGSQNQELTQIAQDFASELGLGDKFDTSYDDAPDYTDLFDGDAQVDLTSPSTNEAIMSAKADVQEAKTAYSESVTNANQYIEEATKAKGDLDSLRASIESVAGKDTSKWTEAQISQYNKAAETYNTAVTKANEEVAAASKAKELYTQAKDNLQKVEESYYNEIREAIKQQNGYDNGGINSTLSGTPGTENLAGTPLGNNPNQTQDVSDEALIEQLFANM